MAKTLVGLTLDYIAEPLRSLAVPIAELHEDPSNARKGHAVDRIAASLKQYGQRKPIVVNRAQGGKVEAGNGTLAAAKSLGWTHIAAVFVDDDAATAAAYGIADNRVGEFSEWDADILGDLMPTLNGLFTGFLPKELDAILPQQHTEGDTEPQVDRADELRQKWGVESGQMWRLGEHRIICGDCTDADVVGRVMDGEKADLMLTDPPYGVDYGAIVRGRENQKAAGWDDIENDALSDEQLSGLLQGALHGAGANVGFVWHPAGARRWLFWEALTSNGWRVAQEIVWVKNALVFGRADYQWRHEPCMYVKREGAPRQEDRTQTTVWEVNKPTDSMHPTQKPIDLFAIPIRNHTATGGIVYEPFSGSGTTIIACENLGRKCRAVEISPGYVAVAIERWATHTGGTPELLP